MILRPDRELTVVNFFAGIGGCALGMKWAGFKSLGSFDLDEKALRDLQRLTGGPVFVCNLALVKLAQLLGWVPICPDVVIMSPPCKKFSDLLPPEQAAAAEYIEMAQLALAGIYLACETWAPKLPAIIVLENVRGITGARGAEILAQIVSLLTRYGYVIDQSMHDCGEIGGIAQHRDRFLLVARQPEVAQDYLRRPPKQRVKNVGEVFEQLPSPLADHGDELHQLPRTSAMTAVRLACVDPNRVVSLKSKGDWRDIPDRVRCVWGPVPERVMVRPKEGKSKQAGKHGVTGWDQPSHTVVGRGAREPARTVVGHASHDNSTSSYADPKVGKAAGWRSDPHRGSFGVESQARPASTVRGRHDPRTAPAAVVDDRGWPVPTHYLVIEDGEHVLYGPELDLKSHKPIVVIILAPDGTWHRPMTDRELAVLQGFPVDAYFEGPSSTRAAQKPDARHPNRPYRPAVPGRREHIGNAIPPPTAHAIGLMIAECLRSPRRATFLRGPDVWVRRDEARMEASPT